MVKVVPFCRLGVCLTADNNGMNGGRIQAADKGGGFSPSFARRRCAGAFFAVLGLVFISSVAYSVFSKKSMEAAG
jgi:hypothetical protein